MNGVTYYQVVHGRRDPVTGQVRHRTLVSLGRQPTVADALAAETEGLANFRAERAKLGGGPFIGRLKRKADRLDRAIDETAKRVAVLRELALTFPES